MKTATGERTLTEIGQRINMAVQLIAIALHNAEISEADLEKFSDYVRRIEGTGSIFDPPAYREALSNDSFPRVEARLKLLKDALKVVETDARFGTIVMKKVAADE